MINILQYSDIDKQQWQQLIERSATATWFQTPEAYAFYASVPDEMEPFAIGVSEDNKLQGLIVGYITREKNPIKQFLTRRAIIIGGPLLDENITAEALSALLNTLRRSPYRYSPSFTDIHRHSPIYIESRNFHDYSKWKPIFENNGFVYKEHLNFHVDCTQENMLATMSESRRRQIKKAIKSGVAIVEAQSQEDVRTYYDILKDLYKNKVKTPLFPLDFFLRFYENGFGKYLLVKYEDKIIGGIMCPILKGRTIYEWFVCGMDEQYKNQYPSVMATYAAIEYAQQNGLSRFDFMGAGKPEEAYGVRDFKARFGGEQVEHGRFLCVRKPLLYWIGKMGVKILKRR